MNSAGKADRGIAGASPWRSKREADNGGVSNTPGQEMRNLLFERGIPMLRLHLSVDRSMVVRSMCQGMSLRRAWTVRVDVGRLTL